MKKICLFTIACIVLLSCHSKQDNNVRDTDKNKVTGEAPAPPAVQKKYFAIESAAVKYKTSAAGQEMIREWCFDRFGLRQYEENYMLIMGEKSGSKSLIIDGLQYQWSDDSDTGTKRNYYQAVTDYDQVSESDIKRYGIQKHGYEEILGKQCLKVTTEKPAQSTIWIWNNIPLKTEAVFAGNKVTMEAIELSEGAVNNDLFELPAGVTFTEQN